MWFVVGLLKLLFVINSVKTTNLHHNQLNCFSSHCNHDELCYITQNHGIVTGKCIHAHIDKHNPLVFGCPTTLANKEHCNCITQTCIDQVRNHGTTVPPVSARGGNHHANLVTCGGTLCHADSVCEHKLDHGAITSHCKKEHEVVDHNIVDCQTVAVLTNHQLCYCRTNLCNERLHNHMYNNSISAHVHNQQIQCGEHMCHPGQYCSLTDQLPDIHFHCSNKIEHHYRNCLPNLFHQNGGCYCQTEDCVNHALISILSGLHTTGIICGNKELNKNVCNPFQSCVITHQASGIFDRQCGSHLSMPLCHSAPQVGHHCQCVTQDCVYGEFSSNTGTTLSPHTDKPTTTHAPYTNAPHTHAPHTAPPTTTNAPHTVTPTTTHAPTTANPVTPAVVHHTSTTGPHVTSTKSPTTGTPLPTHATTLAALTAPPLTTSAPVTTCINKEDSSFSCLQYDLQYNLCMAKSGTLYTIANNRCQKFCGICHDGVNSTQTTQAPGATISQQIVCTDHDARCQKYQSNICNAAEQYVIATCPKTCNKCTQYFASLTSHTTTAAPTPTAAPVTTTAPIAPPTCYTCGDINSGIPCYSREVFDVNSHSVLCPVGTHYCMTDVYQDIHGNTDVFKRCVTHQTCQTKWITESADLDYCSHYGVIKNPGVFECHFCCTGDNCNTAIKPQDSLLVAKPTGK